MNTTNKQKHEAADHTALAVGDLCNVFYLGAPVHGDPLRVTLVGRKWITLRRAGVTTKVLVKHDADACWFTAKITTA